MITRRTFLLQTVSGAALALSSRRLLALPAAPTEITVYKSATCGCCTKWVDHLKANGFKVTAFDTDDVAAIKRRFGVPGALESCHTGYVGGYAIEGHVPAADIKRLLQQKPKVAGLAVPGMPQGSPGMETGQIDRYDVIAFDRAGKTSIFARH